MEALVVVLILAILLLAVVGGAVLTRRGRGGEPAPPGAPSAPSRAPGLGARITRTRHAVGDRLSSLFGRGSLDTEFWSELEDTLVSGDVGVGPSAAIVDRVRHAQPSDTAEARRELHRALLGCFEGRDRALHVSGDPAVVLVVGVNGTGKTTSIAKLAHRFIQDGKRVVLGAADTFRAGAAAQLEEWAGRVGADFVGGQADSDPAAVAFRSLERARDLGADLVIVDTAGRLHSNRNLMEELAKVTRILAREAGKIDETLLVLDATTGQNAIVQAHTFTEAVGVSGIVLSKLDGTARGGVVIAIEQDLDIPVKLVGVGEGMEDLLVFEPHSFVDALLGDTG